MELLSKIGVVFRRHGLLGLLRRVFGRLWRRRSYVIYALDCAETDPSPVDLPQDIRFDLVRSDNIGDLSDWVEMACSLDPEVQDYFDDVRAGRAVGVIARNASRVVHYAFMFRQNKTACLLGLPRDVALIGNAYTQPSFRGVGLQAASVRLRAGAAGADGFRSVVAETAPDNLSSQRGMQRGGMRPLGRLDMLVLFDTLVLRWRRPPGFRALGVCL